MEQEVVIKERRVPLSVRLTERAIGYVKKQAAAGGISQAAVLEIMIRRREAQDEAEKRAKASKQGVL